MAKCNGCGNEIPEGEIFCPICGEEVQLVPNYENLDVNVMIAKNNMENNVADRFKESREDRKKYLKNQKLIRIFFGIILSAIAIIGITVTILTIRSTLAPQGDYKELYNTAKTEYDNKKFVSAYDKLEKALKLKSDDEDIMVLLAKCALELNKIDESENLLLQVIFNNSSSEDGYQALIDVYTKQSKYDEIFDLIDGAKDNSIKIKFKEYLIDAPGFSISGGTYEGERNLVLTCGAEDGGIYYTTDDTEITEASNKYTEPIRLMPGTNHIRARVINRDGFMGKERDEYYTVIKNMAPTPVIKTEEGSYFDNEKIVVEFDKDCKAYYAFDEKPTTGGNEYKGPVEMLEGSHIFYVMCVNIKGDMSLIVAKKFKYTAPEIRTPSHYTPPAPETTTEPETTEAPTAEPTPDTPGEITPTQEPTAEPTLEPTEEPTEEPVPALNPER